MENNTVFRSEKEELELPMVRIEGELLVLLQESKGTRKMSRLHYDLIPLFGLFEYPFLFVPNRPFFICPNGEYNPYFIFRVRSYIYWRSFYFYILSAPIYWLISSVFIYKFCLDKPSRNYQSPWMYSEPHWRPHCSSPQFLCLGP